MMEVEIAIEEGAVVMDPQEVRQEFLRWSREEQRFLSECDPSVFELLEDMDNRAEIEGLAEDLKRRYGLGP